MVARNDRPVLVATESTSPGDALDVTATRDEEGKALVLKVVNIAARPVSAELRLSGFTPKGREADVETLSGPPEAVNTAEQPERFTPVSTRWRHELDAGRASYTFPAHSFTVMRFE
jgi:alpha-L-arabinofuranosidase